MTATETSPLTSNNGRASLTALLEGAPAAARTASRLPEVVVTPPAPTPPAPRKWLRRIMLASGLGLAGVAAGVYYFVAIAPYESTDDAFIDGHVISMAPQVAGQVVGLSVNDNQAVKQGDVIAAN